MTDEPHASHPLQPGAQRPTHSEERRGLYSVAQIHHVLRVEFNRARRHHYPLTCLVIAVDRLEPLRDRFGYDVKERVLDAVVGLLRDATRSSDFLGRTADDRLVAVIPHTDGDGARILAQRIVERARGLRIDRLPEPFPITVSIGTASTGSQPTMFHDVLLASAEAALAEAIAVGGDRCAGRSIAAAAPPGA